MADDLSLDFVGADGIGLGSPFLAEEGEDSIFLKLFLHLIIPLPRQAIFLRRERRPETFTLTLDEHEQARCDLVRVGDEKVAGGADDAPIRELVDHGDAPRLSGHVSVWKGSDLKKVKG